MINAGLLIGVLLGSLQGGLCRRLAGGGDALWGGARRPRPDVRSVPRSMEAGRRLLQPILARYCDMYTAAVSVRRAPNYVQFVSERDELRITHKPDYRE